MSQSQDHQLAQVIAYMQSHWPSQVKPEWQVKITEYPLIAKQVLQDFTKDKTKNRHFLRIAGISGSGKTTQLLPAAEAYFGAQNLSPVLVAARRFVEYHPHHQQILEHYGSKDLRKMTDEFSTIMMFIVISELIRQGYDITLDVTLLDPAMEEILLSMLEKGNYKTLLLMIAVHPEIAESHLQSRNWRHTKETEQEFVRATKKALDFYAKNHPNLRIILWNTFSEPPIYDGPVESGAQVFAETSTITDIPPHSEDSLRQAKIDYLVKLQ